MYFEQGAQPAGHSENCAGANQSRINLEKFVAGVEIRSLLQHHGDGGGQHLVSGGRALGTRAGHEDVLGRTRNKKRDAKIIIKVEFKVKATEEKLF